MRELFFKDEHVAARRRRRLHRHVPPVQDRRGDQSRSDRHLHQRARRPERLPVPAALRIAALDAHGFDVWNAGSQFYGGDAKFVYGIKPFGEKTKPTHRFDATLTGVDLARFTDFEQFPGLRFAGSASLHNLLEWPSGRFAEHRGEGAGDDRAAAGRRRR